MFMLHRVGSSLTPAITQMNWLPEVLPPASPDVTQIDAILRERWVNAESMRRAHRRTTNSTAGPNPHDDAVYDSLDRAFSVACMEVTMWRGVRHESDGLPPALEPGSRTIDYLGFLILVARDARHLERVFQRPAQVTLPIAKLVVTMSQVCFAGALPWTTDDRVSNSLRSSSIGAHADRPSLRPASRLWLKHCYDPDAPRWGQSSHIYAAACFCCSICMSSCSLETSDLPLMPKRRGGFWLMHA